MSIDAWWMLDVVASFLNKICQLAGWLRRYSITLHVDFYLMPIYERDRSWYECVSIYDTCVPPMSNRYTHYYVELWLRLLGPAARIWVALEDGGRRHTQERIEKQHRIWFSFADGSHRPLWIIHPLRDTEQPLTLPQSSALSWSAMIPHQLQHSASWAHQISCMCIPYQLFHLIRRNVALIDYKENFMLE